MIDWTLTESGTIFVLLFGVPAVAMLIGYVLKSCAEWIGELTRAIYSYYIWRRDEKKRARRWKY